MNHVSQTPNLDPSSSHTERELVTILRSIRDLIDTVLMHVGDCGAEPRDDVAPGYEEALSAEPRDAPEDAASSIAPALLRNPQEFLNAIEFLVMRGARSISRDDAPTAGGGDELCSGDASGIA